MGKMENSSINQQFSEIMLQNELLAKENRLLDSYLHRKVGDVNWDEIERDVAKILGRKGDKKEWMLQQYPQLYNIALAEQEYRNKQLKALEEKAAEDISLLRVFLSLLHEPFCPFFFF